MNFSMIVSNVLCYSSDRSILRETAVMWLFTLRHISKCSKSKNMDVKGESVFEFIHEIHSHMK